MRVVGVTAMTVLIGTMGLAVPARAQAESPHINLLADGPSKTPEQVEQEAERDKKYRDSLHKIPDAKVSNDPWGGVRSDAPKTAKAAAKAKTKTGSTQN